MTRAAIYARFSSSRQREESIADQVRVCTQRAVREGWDIAGTYTDEARSGTDAARRPGFQRMVADAERGAFDVVLVYKLDRFARNRYDSATYRARLRRAGVEVVSATEGVPDGPEGIILDSVLEGMAEYYSANLAQNVRRGMEGNALRCRHNGVRVFGYECAADGGYRIDEAEAPGVRGAFRMASEGARKVDIAAWLNQSGYRTVRGRRWGVDSVSRMLNQERYIGVYSWGDVRVEGGMPAIIDGALWEAAHGNVAPRGRKRRTDEPAAYMLTGKLYDAGGNRFESESARGYNGRTYYYYRCRATGARVRKADVESRVADALSRLLDSEPSLTERIVDAVMGEYESVTAETRAALDAARKRIADVDREIDNLIDLAARLGASDRIADRIRELEAERPALEADAAEMERGLPRIEPDYIRYVLYRITCCDGPDAVVAGFVQRVIVDGDGGCVVTFNIYGEQAKENPETPEEAFRGIAFGRPHPTIPELRGQVIPWPGGFAIAA